MKPRARILSAAAAVSAAALLTTALGGSAGAAPSPDTGRPGALPAPLSPSARAALLSKADAATARTAREIGLGSKEKLLVREVVQDADGTTHTRYERTYAGLPVLGGDLVVHTGRDGTARGVTRSTDAKISVPSTKAPATAAPSAARAEGSVPPRKVIWAGDDTPVLAWERVAGGSRADGTPRELHIITDARTGAELHRYDAVHTGIGHGQYAGKVDIGTSGQAGEYTMTDARRGGARTVDMADDGVGEGTLFTSVNDVWGNGAPSSRETAAVDAHYGAGVTWDYFLKVHERNGLRNDGVAPLSRVHFGKNFTNAFWMDRCFCMSYGDGPGGLKPLTALDVVAHEMAHGLVSATAGLVHGDESGGINEATADIFAAAVEFYAGNDKDKGDYLIGEMVDLYDDGSPVRYMDQPSRDGESPDFWDESVHKADVHVSSAIGNHFFYLLAEGSGKKEINGVTHNSPTVDGEPVEGIGLKKAERIWFKAVTAYMTSTADYHDAREASLRAAADLHGEGSAEVKAVDRAWAAVNVR